MSAERDVFSYVSCGKLWKLRARYEAFSSLQFVLYIVFIVLRVGVRYERPSRRIAASICTLLSQHILEAAKAGW